ncbi:ABC transporter ATP-binding protein [Streptomyces chiangmaiensis]|uniref:ABC transporter ATP-binding protein n=1 Tax=Streptomyces chiangmaiensis TaxID=766497 RepID=A0ABU7FS08_9ACTN|nr:ABC transporter ATP-binding protein [Streptomyces chiangmaiensis]MED7826901.1 ABC transporter ATP-binding protein [Streptomyces chiangmaiensis]
MLEIEGVSARYGEAKVLHDVSLRVGEGEVVTLVGRNGAGKTTLLNCAMGLHRSMTGRVRFAGRDVTAAPPHRRARLGLGLVPDDRGVYASLSVEENLTLPPVKGVSPWPLERIYNTFPALAARRRFPGAKLSGGEQQMLALARVLRAGARLLLCDEPTEGLAPVIVQRIGDILREAKEQGVAVLLVEQNLRFATTVADRHYLLGQGRVVESLDNTDVREREGELLAHLGL